MACIAHAVGAFFSREFWHNQYIDVSRLHISKYGFNWLSRDVRGKSWRWGAQKKGKPVDGFFDVFFWRLPQNWLDWSLTELDIWDFPRNSDEIDDRLARFNLIGKVISTCTAIFSMAFMSITSQHYLGFLWIPIRILANLVTSVTNGTKKNVKISILFWAGSIV